jgi:hypothetical protein
MFLPDKKEDLFPMKGFDDGVSREERTGISVDGREKNVAEQLCSTAPAPAVEVRRPEPTAAVYPVLAECAVLRRFFWLCMGPVYVVYDLEKPMLQRIDGAADKLAGWGIVWLINGVISLLAKTGK